MTPFGSLPRPTSRFQRPRQSWTRRLFSATQLRLGFLLLFTLIILVSAHLLWPVSRQYGYFYSLAERQQLWQDLPNARALATLQAIYHQGPYADMLTTMQSPYQPAPGFEALKDQPEYRVALEKIHQATLESQLNQLEHAWYYSHFENLMRLSHQARDFNPSQLTRLLNLRKQVVEDILGYTPKTDEQTEVLCTRLSGTWKANPPLLADDRNELIQKSRHNSYKLIAQLPDSPLHRQSEILRRLRLQVCLAPLSDVEKRQLEKFLKPSQDPQVSKHLRHLRP